MFCSSRTSAKTQRPQLRMTLSSSSTQTPALSGSAGATPCKRPQAQWIQGNLKDQAGNHVHRFIIGDVCITDRPRQLRGGSIRISLQKVRRSMSFGVMMAPACRAGPQRSVPSDGLYSSEKVPDPRSCARASSWPWIEGHRSSFALTIPASSAAAATLMSHGRERGHAELEAYA